MPATKHVAVGKRKLLNTTRSGEEIGRKEEKSSRTTVIDAPAPISAANIEAIMTSFRRIRSDLTVSRKS